MPCYRPHIYLSPETGRSPQAISKVLAISSQVVYGHVGNSAAVFALQRLGHEVWPVPTIVLSHHPGHGRPAGESLSVSLFASLVDALESRGWLQQVDAVISGYFASAEQMEIVEKAVRTVKAANPSAIYLCDPVLGDTESGLYARPGVERAMPRLLACADIVTPNLFELEWLSGPSEKESLSEKSARLGPKWVVTTSSPASHGKMGALAVLTAGERQRDVWQVETELHRPGPSMSVPKGTGDLFAALLLGHVLNGRSVPQAMSNAAVATSNIVEGSISLGRDELAIEELQSRLAADASAKLVRKT